MIRLRAYWWQGVFTGRSGPRAVEWPPSPWRIFAALTAGAHRGTPEETAEERDALRRLASLAPPSIWQPDATMRILPGIFVQTSALPPVGKALPPKILDMGPVVPVDDKRPKGLWETVRVTMSDPEVCYDVEDPDEALSDRDVELLDRAARRVPYIGRSSHLAELTVTRSDGSDPTGTGAHRRRVPVPGPGTRTWNEDTLDDLDAIHEAVYVAGIPGPSPAMLGRHVTYRDPHRRDYVLQSTVAFTRDVEPAEAVGFLTAINGDLDGGIVVPLVQVGHPYSTGRLSGVGVVARDRAAARWIVERLTGVDPFARETGGKNLAVLTPNRWNREAVVWFSATPLALHPDRRIAERQLRRDLTDLVAVEPVQVTIHERPFLPGQAMWRVTVPGGQRAYWARIAFATRVDGPVLVGEFRDRGFGVFAPEHDDEEP